MNELEDKITTAEASAKDLFEEIEFKEVENNEGFISYHHKELGVIMFGMRYKEVLIGNNTGLPRVIKMKELEAINKKVKELGWND